MTRKLTSSRTARWLAAASVLFSIATAALVLRAQDEEVNPIGILFRRRDARNNKQQEEKPPQSKLPSDVPKAPPAQYMQAQNVPAAENVDPLMKYVDEALRLNLRRVLVAEPINGGKPNSPWQIMHGVLALRNKLEVRTNRGVVNAIDWLSRDPMFRGEHWFEATRFGGRAHPFSVPYHFEGHVNQFLSLLTMSNLPLDHKFGVAGGRHVTMADMVRHAQMMVNANEEISWTLWFLTHYLEPDAVWTNFNGERWGMQKLVAMQTGQNVTTAPCGGTHGLFALAYARNSYLQKHGRLTGTWIEADQKIEKYIAESKAWQNRDGSFSAHFFKESGHTEDATDRLKSSGHMLEWLMMAVPQSKLKENWVRAGVFRVAADLVQFSNQEIDPGPLFHAVHAITLYRERVMPKPIRPHDAKPLEPQLANPAMTPRPQTPPPAAIVRQAPPPPAGIEPKVVADAGTPKNPEPPRPVPPPLNLTPGADEKKTVMAPESPKPETPPAATSPSVAIDAPKPVPTSVDVAPVPAPAPASSGDTKAVIAPDTPAELPVVVLPTLPTLNPSVDPTRPALPLTKPIGVAPVPPNPTPVEAPVQVAELPAPPLSTFELRKRSTGDAKPDAAGGAAPRPTSVTSPTPIVLPPLPLDPVDEKEPVEKEPDAAK